MAAALIGGGVAAGAMAISSESDSPSATTVTISAPLNETANAPLSAPAPAPDAAAPAPAPGAAMTIGQVYEKAGPGVVSITQINGQTGGQGSGFVIDQAGYIVTNAHVIEGGGEITVSFSNNDRLKATVVGADNSTDTAVLKVDANGTALHALPIGSSTALRVGDQVVAIGNPFGYDRTVTSGIVSAVGRSIESPNGFAIDDAIQTDAAINHGNSGGPLLNMRGEVIGVNAQITSRSGIDANIGIGFAIPSDLVKQVVTELRATGKVDHPWLGVSLDTVDAKLAERAKLPVETGVMVAEVVPNSPAAAAGLRPATDRIIIEGESYSVGGDIITAVDGKAVSKIEDLREMLQSLDAGDKVELSVTHSDGSKATVSITLGEQPQAAQTDPTQNVPQVPTLP